MFEINVQMFMFHLRGITLIRKGIITNASNKCMVRCICCFYTVNDQQLLRHEMVNFLVTPVEGSSER